MIEALSWDSDFFGFPVGKLFLNAEPDWNEFISSYMPIISGYKLIYFITGVDFLVPDQVLKIINGRYINQKVQYQKQLDRVINKIPEYISEYTETIIQDDFIELAHLSGYYSRFNVDANFPEGKFEELYETWIKKSIDRTIADKVFVAIRNGRIRAMATSKCTDNTCNIGLVAVHRTEQGKGTGRFLLHMIEEQALNHGLKNIQVSTQNNNVIACRFYEKLGFLPFQTTNYYHIWVK